MPVVVTVTKGGPGKICFSCLTFHPIDDFHTFTYRGETRHIGLCKNTITIEKIKTLPPVGKYDEVVGTWVDGYPIFDQHFPNAMYLFEFNLDHDPNCPCTSCIYRAFCWHGGQDILEGIISCSLDGKTVKVLLRFFAIVSEDNDDFYYDNTKPKVTRINSSYEFYQTWIRLLQEGCPKKFGERIFKEVPHAFMIMGDGISGKRVPTE